jgi:hypothetical protein
MNRLDLYYGLWSVLPHAGKRHDYVGLEVSEGEVWTWASDTYTIAVTRQDCDPSLDFECFLPRTEALDLARALRPKNKAQESEQVQLAQAASELHVKVESVLNIKDGGESAVYDLTDDEDAISLARCLHQIEVIDSGRVDTMPHVLNPDLYGRFADAKRSETDYLTFWPRRTPNDRLGAGVVVVGESMIGACLGLDRDPASDVARSFLRGRTKAA